MSEQLIQPGQVISHYEILSLIGEGGMGAVYKARDTELGRTVAMKVLHPSVASDPDRRARFLQEARSASSLNHPNIITIYDLLKHDAADIIVMEFVDGAALDEVLARKAMPLAQTLKVAGQVADALAKAHAAGIVHRDLKPANILISNDGLPKVVDFGIAKLTENSLPAEAVTVALAGGAGRPRTQAGTVMGTAAYMSPEQAEGAHVDARSDIFSFGSVLYEMSTGRQAFQGESVVSTLSSVLRDEPKPISEVTPAQPRELGRIVARCMKKDVARRFQHMADVKVALEELREEAEAARTTSGVAPVAAVPVTPPQVVVRRTAVWTVGAAGLLLGAMIAYVLATRDQPPAELSPLVSESGSTSAPAWSPDGQTLAYVLQGGDGYQILSRNPQSTMQTRLVTSKEPISHLFWAPDGTRIYYQSGGGRRNSRLWSVGAAGGAPQLVNGNASIASIAPDGRTLASFHQGKEGLELWIGPFDGKERTQIKDHPFVSSFSSVGVPLLAFSPDGSKLAVSFVPRGKGTEQGEGTLTRNIWIVPYPNGKPYRVLRQMEKRLPFNPSPLEWMPDSRHLVLDAANLEVGSAHLALADTVSGRWQMLTNTPLREQHASVSADGRAIAFESQLATKGLMEAPLSDKPVRTLLSTAFQQSNAAWMPDGQSFAYAHGAAGSEIRLRHADGSWDRTVVTASSGPSGAPRRIRASPDGQRLLFSSSGSKHQIYVVPAAGGKPIAIDPNNPDQHASDWSPDGNWIAYSRREQEPTVRQQIVKVSSGGGQPVVVVDNVEFGQDVRWSPDGNWIAYQGQLQIFLVSPDGKRKRELGVFRSGFTFARGGRSIICMEDATALIEVDVATGVKKKIRDLDLSGDRFTIDDIHPDGTRLIGTVTSTKTDIWKLEGFPRTISGPARWLPWLFTKK